MAGLQRPRDAIEGFKRVVQLNPEDASAYVNMATAYSALDDHTAAIRRLRTGLPAVSGPACSASSSITSTGFTLVDAGRDREAFAVFDRMKKEATGANLARGFGSTALLEMCRGRYGAAVDEIRQAIVLNQTHRAPVSDYRDRLILYSALQSMGRQREAEPNGRPSSG